MTLNIALACRKSSVNFASALAAVGIRVHRVMRVASFEFPTMTAKSDIMVIKGKSKFNVAAVFNYERNVFHVRVYTKKGTQMKGDIQTYGELKALFQTWGIGSI